MSPFSWVRVRAVLWKDLLELRKNRSLLYSMVALPAVIVVVPIGVVLTYVSRPDDPNLVLMARYYDGSVEASSAAAFLVEKVLSDWFSLYLVMPVFVPILISSHAIAGEKEKRTLEPLLASPITPLELLAGKSLASLIPAFAICVAAFAVLCVGVDMAVWDLLHAPLLPNTLWTFGVFVIAPLFAFFGNGAAVLISARVGDSRLAQQLAGMFVLPLVGLAGSLFAGALTSGLLSYGILGGFMLLVDVVLVLMAPRLVDRDRLMSRWG